jgi:hypothetical protein
VPHQQPDEDRRLHKREGSKRPELDRDRVEEHDLDVEQDEQHRDQVEADPEAEALPDLGRQAAFVRVDVGGAHAVVALHPEQRVQQREGASDRGAEGQEHDRRQVRLEHRAWVLPPFVTR